MIGDLEIDEINTSNNIIRISNSKIAVEVFDEVSMNSSLANNTLAETHSRAGPANTISGLILTKESIVGPFGTTETLLKISSNQNTNAAHYHLSLIGFLKYEGTFSIFAKAAEARFFNLTCDDSGSGGFYAVFDALTGQVVSRHVNVGTNLGATADYYGNGWWRFSVSGRIADTTATGAAAGELSRFAVNLLGKYTDNGWYDPNTVPLGDGLYIAYWQVEPNTFVSALKLDTKIPFANLAMRLEKSNTTNTTFIVDRNTTLFVGSEFDEVNTII
jgi:hypothetical protein